MSKQIIGIKFRESGRVYNYDPGQEEIELNDLVIVNTKNGEEFGRVVIGPHLVSDEVLKREPYSITRKANEKDLEVYKNFQEKIEYAKNVFIEQVKLHGLKMKLVDVVYTRDGRKILFYYTADKRVDFRALVRDMSVFFDARLELRHIGIRDEARKCGSLGICGRKCCCSSWLPDYAPATIKMAKEQNLSLNASKISGVCGRLLCCLNYEEAYYEEVSKKMPAVGDQLITPIGVGTVYKLNTLDQAVLMKIINDRDEVEIKRYTLEELEEAKKQAESEEKEVQEINIPEYTPKFRSEKLEKRGLRKRRPKKPFGVKQLEVSKDKGSSDKKDKAKADKKEKSKKKFTVKKKQSSRKLRKNISKKSRSKKYSPNKAKKSAKTGGRKVKSRKRNRHRTHK